MNGETIGRKTIVERIESRRESRKTRLEISRGKRNIELCVISIQMKRSSGIRQEISKRSSVETEAERAENRALWNTGRNGSRRREMRIYRNRMRAVVKIRRKKGKSRTRNTKVGRESGEEDLVVDSGHGWRSWGGRGGRSPPPNNN